MRTNLLVIFSFITFIANGQFTKGDKVLGGTFYLYSQNGLVNSQYGGVDKTRTFSVTPSFGFFINDNFAIGGLLGYSYSLQENTYTNSVVDKYDSESFSVGVSAQRYFKISDHFLFSILGQFGFSRGVQNNPYFDDVTGEIVNKQTNSYSLVTSIMPNFTFFPSPKWGFNASIGSISHTFSRSLTNDDKSNSVSLKYGSIGLGVSYYFRNSTDN